MILIIIMIKDKDIPEKNAKIPNLATLHYISYQGWKSPGNPQNSANTIFTEIENVRPGHACMLSAKNTEREQRKKLEMA